MLPYAFIFKISITMKFLIESIEITDSRKAPGVIFQIVRLIWVSTKIDSPYHPWQVVVSVSVRGPVKSDVLS